MRKRYCSPGARSTSSVPFSVRELVVLHSAFLRRWLGTQTVCPLSIRGQCPIGRIPVALGDLSASQAAFRVYESFQRVQDVADLGVQLLEG